jgi:hypothetical protein
VHHPSPPAVTGYGATDAAWNAAHTRDSKYAPGAVYNPDPSLNTGDEYTQVLHQDGHVTGYDLHFANVPISQAKAEAFAQDLPSDATQLWFDVKDTCADMLVQSKTLSTALGSRAIGDTDGTVLVEFGSGLNEDHYSADRVSDALFILSPKTSPGSAPGC